MADTQDTGAANTEAVDAQGTVQAGAPTGAPDAGTQATDATNTAATKAPETEAKDVVYDIKAPEGVELDQSQVDEFKALAKEAKLAPDAAQKFADIAIKAEAARREAWVKQVETWGSEVAADKELGNAENQAAMRSVVDRFGTPELKTLLNSSGMGNHPTLARFVFNISKALSEDSIKGKATGEAPRDAASILYPTTAKA